jgi:arsenate reductase-like glutaredoxin family protein
MDDGITLYHNPRCSNSRAVLALLQERHLERVMNFEPGPISSLPQAA